MLRVRIYRSSKPDQAIIDYAIHPNLGVSWAPDASGPIIDYESGMVCWGISVQNSCTFLPKCAGCGKLLSSSTADAMCPLCLKYGPESELC